MRMGQRIAMIVVVLMMSQNVIGDLQADPVGGEDSLSGRITISGAWALYPMAIIWAEEFKKLHPNVRFDISAGGAGKGMADALGGMVDVGMVSRDVYSSEKQAGAWWVSVAKDAVVVTINAENPFIADLRRRGLTRQELVEIFLDRKTTQWNQLIKTDKHVNLRVYTRSDACGAAKTWAKYLGGHQEDLAGIGVFGDPGVAEAVRKDALGVGYNNINFAFDPSTGRMVTGLMIAPIDLNSDGEISREESFYGTRDELTNAIASGAYPSPPARDLHFVCKGKPSEPCVRSFLRWILTDGQGFVSVNGYVRLSEGRLKTEREKLRETKQ